MLYAEFCSGVIIGPLLDAPPPNGRNEMEQNMNKKLLCGAVLSALVFSSVAVAQEYDDRWYASTGATLWNLDNDRETSDTTFGLQFGVGRFFSRNFSLDAEFNYMNPQKSGSDLLFTNYGVSLDGRYHFIQDGRSWNPYLLAGAGVLHHAEEFELINNPNSPAQISGNNVEYHVGAGLQANYGHWAIRTEVRGRFDNNDESAASPRSDFFTEFGVGINVLYRFGEVAKPAPAPVKAAPLPPPPPPAPTCDQLDDDGDGVNNCEDKCPTSQAGQAIGPDGCPVALTIDLRGVNYDFDKATLRPESAAILDEAASVLSKYPQLKVEVAGHTDSIGAEVYNQGLSERRAKAAYDYLIAHGASAAQLVGPNGYGESRPIDSNDSSDGRARNRRTELNVQN
jgi:OOP family OmpA-OmpF porin